MKTPCAHLNNKASPLDLSENGQTVEVNALSVLEPCPTPLPQTRAPEPVAPLSPVGELYNKLFGDDPATSPTSGPSLECTVARLGRPPSGESLSRHTRVRAAGASRTDVQVERLSETEHSLAMAMSPGPQRRTHRKTTSSCRKKQSSGSPCNVSPTPHHTQQERTQEAVIVPSRRKTRSTGPSPTAKSRDFRAMTTDAPMDVELSTQFRPPCSRYEAPTKERVLGGSGHERIPKPPEEQVHSRDVRAEDKSQEHIFGASEQMIQRGVKEWPMVRSHKLKYRQRPGDDSQNKVCWWLEGSEVEARQMEASGEGEGVRRDRKYRQIPLDNIRELLDDETAAKAAAEYLAAERERRSRKRRPVMPNQGGGLIYSSFDVIPETEAVLAPIMTQKVLSKRSNIDSQKRLFGAPEEHVRHKVKGLKALDTKGRLFGDNPLHIRRCSSRPGSKAHAHSSIFGEMSKTSPTKNQEKMPLSARAPPNRNPISGEGLAPSSKSSTSCSMKLQARGNPISGEGIPSPRIPAASIRHASDSRCNPITGEGYNKNRREIWVTTCRI